MSHPFSSLFSVIFKDEHLLRKRLTIRHLPQWTVHFSGRVHYVKKLIINHFRITIVVSYYFQKRNARVDVPQSRKE